MATEEQLEAGQDLTPAEWHHRWHTELDAAKKRLKKWHEQAEKIEERYLDERPKAKGAEKRRNLFTSGVQTQEATLYGNTPGVSVSRRFADSSDDVARVAGEMLERALNTDIERDGDDYADALGMNVIDWLLAGFGALKLRYVATFEEVPEVPAIIDAATGLEKAATVPAHQRKTWEDVESDYLHWKDMLWSVCRIWKEVRWLAFRAELSRQKLVEKFGEEVGKAITLGLKQEKGNGKDAESPWDRAEVWEIWDGASKRVFHYVEDYPKVLFPVANPKGEDPLKLEGFWPCPRPMLKNLTNSKLVPRPDFVIHQDLYNEIDDLTTRIGLLQDAVRVAGIYDKSAGVNLEQVLDAGFKNVMIPVDKWAMLAEKGGLRGIVDWFPLEQVVNALNTLRDYRREVRDEVDQLTGMSDIMRGQGSGPGVTATEQGIKARFGSVRMQRAQDEIARYATEGQRLRAEIICKHFDPQTIIDRSNVAFTPDKKMAQAAVELLKSGLSTYRIEVKPESVSLTDFAALKQERTEVIDAVSKFLGAAQPLIQQSPASAPYLLEMLKWFVSGLRGSAQIEGVLDRAIEAAQQMAQQPQAQQPDPKLAAKRAELQLKGQIDQQKIAYETQAEVVKAQLDIEREEGKQESQARWNLREAKERDIQKAVARALVPQAPYGGPR